jgi:preprotein translocase subunit SecG
MAWLIGILTFILVVVCGFLSLLILAQKPKKDTGGGLAFGGAATDALFGAGSGDMFTKLTKYAATSFFVLVLLLSLINAQASKHKTVDPRQKVSAAEKQALADAEKAAAEKAAAASSMGTSAPAATGTTSTSRPAPGLLVAPSPGLTSAPAPTAATLTNATTPAPKPEAEKK